MLNFENQKVPKNIINKFYEKNIIPNMLLIGNDDINKEKYIIEFIENYFENNKIYFKSQVLYLNIIIDRSIKRIREIIKKFIHETSYYKDDKNIILKFIIIHNIENINFEIQYALRRIIEDNNKKIRFILIGNNSQTIIQPLISRCLLIYFNNSSVEEKKYVTNNKNINKIYPIQFIKNNIQYLNCLKKYEIEWNEILDVKNMNDMYSNVKKLCNKNNNNIYYILDKFTDFFIDDNKLEIKDKLKVLKIINSQLYKIINNGDIFLNLFYIFMFYKNTINTVKVIY